MNIYIASSWRNTHQQEVVRALREASHEVYDFKDSAGFHWSSIDPHWTTWTPKDYLFNLLHEKARKGFHRDMAALLECDACVMVMPCGMSAALETGWVVGAGKFTIVYVPELREPDLMVKMAHLVTDKLDTVIAALREYADTRFALNPR